MIHPNDPPFQILWAAYCDRRGGYYLDIEAVDNPHNGLTFYAGSLGTGEQNDTRELARKFAKRTHFVHLRSTKAMPAVVDDELYGKSV